MIIIASLLAVAVGLGIIYISWKEMETLNYDIDLLKTLSGKKGRIKTSGRILSLGINTDFPVALLNWPQEQDYEDKDEYTKAVNKAVEFYHEALAKIEVFGGFKIEYEYTAPDGSNYISRTVERIPYQYPLELIYTLKIGSKVSAYLNPDDFGDSILKATNSKAFSEYRKQIQKPQRAKIMVGCAIAAMGVASPWMPWTFAFSQ